MDLPFEVVDTYAHCGLRKYQPIEEMQRVMRATGVGRVVLVQHLGEYDDAYIGGIAHADPERVAAACLVDDRLSTAPAKLRGWTETGEFRGARLTERTSRCVRNWR